MANPGAPRVVVTTCRAYAPVTMPVLLQSLDLAGVPRASVTVVCGQTPADAPAPWAAEGVEVACVPYTAEALTGLVAVAGGRVLGSAAATDMFAYLQDTMAVGADFRARLAAVAGSVPSEVHAVRLLDRFSLSVGLYEVGWVRGARQRLEGMAAVTNDDVAAMREIKTWCEDALFDACPPERCRYLGRFGDPTDRAVLGDFRYAPDAASRTIEHYPSLDLYKFKSWDGNAERVGTYTAADGTEKVAIPVGV